MNIGWHLLELPALSLCTAAIEVDGLLVGQWMVSRPIIVGPMLGAVLGAPFVGAAFGALFEAFSIETAPVGSFVPMNGTVAAACAVLMSAGPAAVPPAAALPAGLALGLAATRVDHFFRERRGRLTEQALSSLKAGGRVPWASFLGRSVGGHAAAIAVFIYAAVAASGAAAGPLWSVLPQALRMGLSTAFDWAPWLALAILLRAMSFRGR